MNKQEAVQQMVDKELESIPTEWIGIIQEKFREYQPLPMWGWMWQVSDIMGARLEKLCRPMSKKEKDNYDEEMDGVLWLPNTAIYLYNIDGRRVIGINAAGYDFFATEWLALYDALGLEWHDKKV